MLGSGDLLQIKSTGTYLGQEFLNVFFYRASAASSATNYATQAADDFEDTVLAAAAPCVNTGVVWTNVEVRNLSNGLDFANWTPTTTGTVAAAAADRLPSYLSLTYRMYRSTLATRDGWKRFPGLYDGAVSGNDLLNPTATAYVDLGNALLASLEIDASPILVPIIVKRPLPEPSSPYIYSTLSAVGVPKLGTQDTRKP